MSRCAFYNIVKLLLSWFFLSQEFSFVDNLNKVWNNSLDVKTHLLSVCLVSNEMLHCITFHISTNFPFKIVHTAWYMSGLKISIASLIKYFLWYMSYTKSIFTKPIVDFHVLLCGGQRCKNKKVNLTVLRKTISIRNSKLFTLIGIEKFISTCSHKLTNFVT